MSARQDDILIIGAGVAGLVLAQGLKHRGIPFKVFEREESLSAKHQGYRFRCEGPGLEALEETVSPQVWELIESTHPKDSPPIMTILDTYTAEKSGEMNTIADPSPRAQRCYPIDRAWFRELLHKGIEDDVSFGKNFESYTLFEENARQRVEVTFTDKTTAVGRLLVAADGVRSRVRRQILPQLKQVDTERMVLWGRTPLNDTLRSKMPHYAFATHFAMTIDARHPTRAVLWAPIEWPKDQSVFADAGLKSQEDYVFWALPTEANKAVLSHDATLEDKLSWIDHVSSEWNAGLRELFKDRDNSTLTVLPVYSSCPDLEEWESNPCITLLGDAIHAMAPTGGPYFQNIDVLYANVNMAGVGGRTAIEDARDLCLAVAAAEKEGTQWTEQQRKYERDMRVRANAAIEHSFRNAKMMWQGKDWWEYERSI